MSEHTPGPWRVGGVEDLRHGRGRQIAADDAKICVVYGVRDPDVKANANLIAAAPEMLEALRSAMQCLDDFVGDGPTYRMVEAAIAKAEGKRSVCDGYRQKTGCSDEEKVCADSQNRHPLEHRPTD